MGREGWYVVPADPQLGGLKKKGAASRNWILMDSDGQDTILDDDKYAIMDRVQIHARDLRIIDPILSYPSTILGREKAIVLNLEHIKAIITADEVLLRDPLDDNVIPVVEELRRRLPLVKDNHEVEEDGKEMGGQHDVETAEDDGNPESPFEFRALEVTLEAICSFLAARATELETAAYPALDQLTSKTSSRNLDRVRKLKSAMTRLTARAQKVRDELEQLLDDDDDMADLYLSRKLASSSSPVSGSGSARWFYASPTIGLKISRANRASFATVRGDVNDVEELEMLLEAYFMQIDGTLNKLTMLREYIDDTEDYINIQLDNHRNQLIQLELYLSAATVSMSLYSVVAGIFGMNIPNTWNDGHGYLFKWIQNASFTSADSDVGYFQNASFTIPFTLAVPTASFTSAARRRNVAFSPFKKPVTADCCFSTRCCSGRCGGFFNWQFQRWLLSPVFSVPPSFGLLCSMLSIKVLLDLEFHNQEGRVK